VIDFVWSGKHKLSHNHFILPAMLPSNCLHFKKKM